MVAPLCSIIIPTYNHGKYIERSVQSALDQTYPNTEVIVVDDGSTDDTRERVERFSDRVTYIRKENTGRGDNRNKAIEKSRGKYIQFLDADDTIEPEKIELQAAVLEGDESIACVYSDCASNAPDGTEAENVSYSLGEDEDPLPILLRRTLFGIHAALVRRSAVVEVGMFDPDRLAQEDWDLWLKLALSGYRYKYVPGNLARYDHRGSTTVVNPALMYQRMKNMLDKYIADPFFNRLDKKLINEFVLHQNIQLATRAYNTGRWKLSRQHFLRAIKANPKLVELTYWACIPKSLVHQMADAIKGKHHDTLND